MARLNPGSADRTKKRRAGSDNTPSQLVQKKKREMKREKREQGMSDEEKCSQEGRKRRPLTQSREGWRRHTTKLERKGSRVAPDSIVGCGLPQDLREREDRGTSVCSAPHLLVHPQIKEV